MLRPPYGYARTTHIAVDVTLCRACGRCVEVCRSGVLGIVSLWRHRHVHMDHAGRCKGCGACCRTRPAGAIRTLAAG